MSNEFRKKTGSEDLQWETAQAALAAAQAMPAGADRIAALKTAGKMRFAALEKKICELTIIAKGDDEQVR